MLIVLISFGFDTPPFSIVVELSDTIRVERGNQTFPEILLNISSAIGNIPKETIDELLVIDDNQLRGHYKRKHGEF